MSTALPAATAGPRVMAPADFQLLALSYCLASAQFWMTVPLAALALAGRGVPAWQIGIVGAVPWLVLVLAVPFVPGLAARLGAMPVYRLGIWLALAGAVVFAVAQSLWSWVVAYALCGMGIAVRWVVADSLIAALAPPGARGHRIGLFETLVGGTMALGPAVLVVAGTDGALPYAVGIGLVAAAALPTLRLRLDAPLSRAGASFAGLRQRIARQPVAMVLAATAGLTEGAATKLLPVQALGLGFDPGLAAATVAAFGAGNLLTQYATGWAADRFRPARLAGTALVACAALALLLPAAAAATAPAYGLALCLLGGLVGSVYTLAVFEAGNSGAPQDVMAVIAGISVAYTAGSTLGPLLGGAATSASLVWGLPVLIAGSVVLAAAALPRLRAVPVRASSP
jgi:MFS family permease